MILKHMNAFEKNWFTEQQITEIFEMLSEFEVKALLHFYFSHNSVLYNKGSKQNGGRKMQPKRVIPEGLQEIYFKACICPL